MNTIAASEIKRRGISAVDDLLPKGPVHVIAQNEARYVVMDEARYQEMRELSRAGLVAQVREARAAIDAGRYERFTHVADLMAAIDAADEDEDETP